jgi:catechol 2,3-dioxygenase-like lactoylglutathione lyase family enzyme
MERIISRLVSRYEGGSLTRRELIQTLALFATVQAHAADEVLTIASINHVSVQVSDLQRSADFYKRVFGLTDARSDAETARLASGRCHVSLRRGNPIGVIDHFAFGVNQFDQNAVTAELKRRGAVPRQEPQFGFHVTDPDGVRVQISENDAKHR